MQSAHPLADDLLNFLEELDLTLTAHKFDLDYSNESNKMLKQELRITNSSLKTWKSKVKGVT